MTGKINGLDVIGSAAGDNLTVGLRHNIFKNTSLFAEGSMRDPFGGDALHDDRFSFTFGLNFQF